MQSVESDRIQTRLQECHSSDRNWQHTPSVLFPEGTFVHSVDYETLVTLPQYLLDAQLTPGIDARFDQFSYWGWTAAAIETIVSVLGNELSLPLEVYPKSWEFDVDDEPERYISGVVRSRFTPLQTVFRFTLLYGRLERTVSQSSRENFPPKAAILGDLPRTIEYMTFAILEGMATDVVGEMSSASWGNRVRSLLDGLSDDTRAMFEDINYLGTSDDNLPSYAQSIHATHRDLIEQSGFTYSTFYQFLTQYRNRLYHNARGGVIGQYVLTLTCAVVWDRLTARQYRTIRERVLKKLDEDLEDVDSSYDPNARFEEFCLCSGGKRYLECYPFSRAELATEEFNWTP